LIAYVYFAPGITDDMRTREILEKTARTCPVERSLHPDIELDLQFIWP
jgi:hypothetical protein